MPITTNDCSADWIQATAAKLFVAAWPFKMPRPVKIIHNPKAVIVFWNDDTKTVVKRMEGDKDDIYAGFTAALAKKIYGSNSAIKRLIEDNTVEQKGEK